MLQLLKKLKLYTKLAVQKQHVSIHIKTYLWWFMDCQDLQKYFYNWNIRCCFICKINNRGNFIWKHPWYHEMPIFRHHYFAYLEKGKGISNRENWCFFKNLDTTGLSLIKKRIVIPMKNVDFWLEFILFGS